MPNVHKGNLSVMQAEQNFRAGNFQRAKERLLEAKAEGVQAPILERAIEHYLAIERAIPEEIKKGFDAVAFNIRNGYYDAARRELAFIASGTSRIAPPRAVWAWITKKVRFLREQVEELETEDQVEQERRFSRSSPFELEGAVIPFRPTGRALRDVTLTGAERLLTWDTGRKDRRGQTIIGYAFWPSYKNPGKPLFTGSDFAGSPLHADDSDETLRALLGFLTLRPGDTDRDYFDGYTDEQMAYAQGDAEYHQQWTDEEFAPPFIDRKKLAGRIGPL